MINSMKIIRTALKEDVVDKDITSSAIQFKKKIVSAKIIAKEKGIICGTGIAAGVFSEVSSRIKTVILFKDGDKIKSGDVVMKIKGEVKDILRAERTALNFLSHLSGISTYTRKFVQRVKQAHSSCNVFDTRKTLPALRAIEKYAVVVGGGVNHRFNLAESILIKENHLAASGKSIKEIISGIPKKTTIEIEVQNLSELKEALACGVDIIMLDNFSLKKIKIAMNVIRLNTSKVLIEVSGGVNLDNIGDIAKTGVDRISTGRITNSAPALDFTLLLC